MGFTPDRDLNERVAAMIAPTVTKVAAQLARTARAPGYAPATKRWQSREDERVRPEHTRTARDNTDVPANLRFVVHTDKWEIEHRSVPPRQLAHAPRDPALSIGSRINCRCRSIQDVAGIRRTISAQPAVVRGSTVTAEVVCTHPRAQGAEFGEGIDSGTRFLGRALRDTVARMKGDS
jgi:hypothetical protein